MGDDGDRPVPVVLWVVLGGEVELAVEEMEDLGLENVLRGGVGILGSGMLISL